MNNVSLDGKVVQATLLNGRWTIYLRVRDEKGLIDTLKVKTSLPNLFFEVGDRVTLSGPLRSRGGQCFVTADHNVCVSLSER